MRYLELINPDFKAYIKKWTVRQANLRPIEQDMSHRGVVSDNDIEVVEEIVEEAATNSDLDFKYSRIGVGITHARSHSACL
jgi:hypothetical protein